ncbi:MAG: CvpA family protein [Pseudomonadota bacterium]
MATLDVVILIIVSVSALMGVVRGLVKELLSLVGWVVAFVTALMFAEHASVYLPVDWGESIRVTVAFIGLFIGVLVAAGIVQWLVAKLIKSTGLGSTDRFLGLVFGAGRGLLVVLVLLIVTRDTIRDAQWYREASLPGELLAFEGELRDATDWLREQLPGFEPRPRRIWVD